MITLEYRRQKTPVNAFVQAYWICKNANCRFNNAIELFNVNVNVMQKLQKFSFFQNKTLRRITNKLFLVLRNKRVKLRSEHRYTGTSNAL